MKTADIRTRFLEFFAARGHAIVPSSSLVPANDPTLLFTNAGMNQFKDVFLGQDKRPYVRATTAQRCVRAGGKHNDLENVGYTARHHTFFEMLGNFSFGDYFKRDAIRYAWELLTKEYGLPADKLWTTVYVDDDEAYDVWTKEIGVPLERCIRIGDNKGAPYASDNFWMMGDTGPCGPCSEIFYDHGPEVWGGPPGSPESEGDRYIEIWNLVFMQFNRDDKGTMHPLPKPSVDTGMGLERLAAVLQHVHSNYEIDLFQELIRAAVRETGATDYLSPSLRVIADHIRACAFLIVDGVIPGSEGRGYVLRRIIRRAIRHGYQLGQKAPFFHKLVPDLDRVMGNAYPELRREAKRVAQVLKQEEERFGETIENGMKMLEQALAAGTKVLDGETAFTLYDTYGFPFDLTADVCRERNVTVDETGFDRAMNAQRERARAASQFKMGAQLDYAGQKTRFRGYETLSAEGRVTALYKEGASVPSLSTGESGVVVLSETPFYAESGGQVGDRGELTKGGACLTLFAVDDTQKIQADVYGHIGEMKTGELKIGDVVAAQVDQVARARTVRNHSATHLMHKALREVLGAHVQQKGSLVDSDKTRFDFAHNAPLTDDEIRRVEAIVNRRDPGERADASARDADRRGAKGRRDDALRREIRRRGSRARHRQLARTLRRHARRAHRRRRLFQDRRRGRRRGRHPPRRGRHRRQRAQVGSGAGGEDRGRGGGAEGTCGGNRNEDCAADRKREDGRAGARQAQGEACILGGRRPRRQRGRRQGHEGAGGDRRRRRCQGPARDDGQTEGQVEERGNRPIRSGRRQGHADRRSNAGPHLEGEGGRAREPRRAAGRRQGWRAAGHGAGGWHRSRGSSRGAAIGRRLGGAAAVKRRCV